MKFLTIFLLALLSASAAAEITEFLHAPDQAWEFEVPVPGVGNACAYAPGDLIICTSKIGTVTAVGAQEGKFKWKYLAEPADAAAIVSCTSGITFSSNYMVYGVTEALADVVTCRVHALNMDGSPFWVSKNLAGACSGTPVVSFNENYVFLTHSEDQSGTFTVLEAADGNTFYQESDTDLPLSPPGIFHNPIKGNYRGGEGNRNDILVWANKPSKESVNDNAASYAFQFPIGFTDSDNGDLGVVTLLNSTDLRWEATAPPLITDGGTSMYWGVSRSSVLAWPDRSFDVSPGGNNIGFPRGKPASLPVIAEIAETNSVNSPTILFSGGAGLSFSAINFTGSGIDTIAQEKWTITTTTTVNAKAQVAPNDEVVYVIEDGTGTTDGGIVHQINAANGTVLWTEQVATYFPGSGFAQSPTGDVIYFAGQNVGSGKGVLRAWGVANLAPTTAAPVVMTPAPVATPAPVTPAPVVAPTQGVPPPTSAPMAATSAEPTPMPVTAAPGTVMPGPPTSSAAITSMMGFVTVIIVGVFM